MSELKRKILNILFWIFLIITIILIIWRIFGSSPNDLSIIISITFMLMFKMWDISDELKEHKTDYRLFKENVRGSFAKVKEDFENLKGKKIKT